MSFVVFVGATVKTSQQTKPQRQQHTEDSYLANEQSRNLTIITPASGSSYFAKMATRLVSVAQRSFSTGAKIQKTPEQIKAGLEKVQKVKLFNQQSSK